MGLCPRASVCATCHSRAPWLHGYPPTLQIRSLAGHRPCCLPAGLLWLCLLQPCASCLFEPPLASPRACRRPRWQVCLLMAFMRPCAPLPAIPACSVWRPQARCAAARAGRAPGHPPGVDAARAAGQGSFAWACMQPCILPATTMLSSRSLDQLALAHNWHVPKTPIPRTPTAPQHAHNPQPPAPCPADAAVVCRGAHPPDRRLHSAWRL